MAEDVTQCEDTGVQSLVSERQREGGRETEEGEREDMSFEAYIFLKIKTVADYYMLSIYHCPRCLVASN